MKNIYFYFAVFLSLGLITSCSSSSKVTSYKKSNASKNYKSTSNINKSSAVYRASSASFTSKDSNSLLKIAKSYIGVPYKYGGSNTTGFDCSGLVMVSFEELGLKLPRNSAQQSENGKEIKITDVRQGDLLFFNTSGNSISHVGIIESIEKTGEIKFIHSSTSKGVIISSLDENYWRARFVKATRLL
jgi:cell wall-associated NlpC family hydrolase